MSNHSEAFARLLKGAISSIAAYEGKTSPAIELDLGGQIGVSGATIQRWKSGTLPSDERAVEVLAAAAIQRGYLGREWLQRFLHAARYPFADKLLDRLCPVGPARTRPPRVYHNLPAPTYSQFVMRQLPYDEVIDGLQQRSAVVLVVGLGGNGKTSLVREIAAQCLKDDSDAPHFDAMVWVSDKDRPGTTNLSVVLDEIARTLDYPGFTQFEHEEKRREVENLLRRQRVLVVVDNFETISDGALLSWLLRMPEPSKAIVTSREYGREFRRSCWPVELRGMSEEEAQQFIGQRLRVLRIEKLVGDQAQLEPLVVATGGNPKAIEIALGLVKHERRPLQQVVDDLYAARGELFDDLFTRAWALLDEAARRVLLVMTFFPDSASGDALSATADVHGFAFDRAAERLTDLALIDVQQVDLSSAPRYTLHPLVRAFAGARLAEQPGFEEVARDRWVRWYGQLAAQVGFCWRDPSRLDVLDSEQETIYSIILWTSQQNRHSETIEIAMGVHHYYYVRGFWDKLFTVESLGIEAARRMSEPMREIKATVRLLQMLGLQGRTIDMEKYLLRLDKLAKFMECPDSIYEALRHAHAWYSIAIHDFSAAQQAWKDILADPKRLPVQDYIRCRHWQAFCLYQATKLMDPQERAHKLAEAQQIFHEVLSKATEHGYQRSVRFCHLHMAEIALDQKEFGRAMQALMASRSQADLHQDRPCIAHIQRAYARLHTSRGDLSAARAALAEAIDLFERLGMRRELAEAREALADLDARTGDR